ncbi:hypothetical protein [Corynebacterium mastitidis]|uniref:hypothetical protein n=1 Tax=Corynebacterium mastitidis TaxID=161890 RepID=UPI0030EA0C8D
MSMPSAESMRFLRVAYEGAQVRALSRLTGAPELIGARPRSLIVLATDALAAASARLAVALKAPLRLPVVVTRTLPGYVGPLDAVLVAGGRAEDEPAAQAMSVAARRGATVIYAGPTVGPLWEEAPERALLLDAPQAAPALSPARTMMAAITAMDLMEEDPRLVASRLGHLADAMDQEIERVHPERDEVVNPARNLWSWCRGARVMHTGHGEINLAVAQTAAQAWSAYELPSGAGEPEALAAATAAHQDIFFDPFLDAAPGSRGGREAVLPLKVVVWGASRGAVPGGLEQTTPAAQHGPTAEAACLLVRALAATVPLRD